MILCDRGRAQTHRSIFTIILYIGVWAQHLAPGRQWSRSFKKFQSRGHLKY